MSYKFDELSNHTHALNYLAEELGEGGLVLFLGAGASKPFGLPSWIELVNSMRLEVNLSPLTSTNSADDLQHAADEVRDKLENEEELIDLIQKHLYGDIANLPIVDVFKNHLLVSISALLMGSKRGRITRVVTLNYDSMLEWFLSLFGFVVKTVHELPALEGAEDVRIYHPHGYIPHPNFSSIRSNFAILGMSHANERLGTTGDPWFEMTRHVLNTGICIFIGMSSNTLDDRALAPLFTTCGNSMKDIRPLGIWMLLEQIESPTKQRFFRKNIVPLTFSNPSEISEFLLNICQVAMKKIK